MRISDWSSDVCSSDLVMLGHPGAIEAQGLGLGDSVENLAVKRFGSLPPLRRIAEIVEVAEAEFASHAPVPRCTWATLVCWHGAARRRSDQWSVARSEEGRGGKGWGSTCRFRGG